MWPPPVGGGDTSPCGFLPGRAGGGGFGRFPPGEGLLGGVGPPLKDGCLGGITGPEELAVLLAGGEVASPPFLCPLEGGEGLSGTPG